MRAGEAGWGEVGVLPVPGAGHHAVAPQTEGVAGRRGAHFPQAGRSSQEGAECGRGCAEAWGTLRGAAPG